MIAFVVLAPSFSAFAEEVVPLASQTRSNAKNVACSTTDEAAKLKALEARVDALTKKVGNATALAKEAKTQSVSNASSLATVKAEAKEETKALISEGRAELEEARKADAIARVNEKKALDQRLSKQDTKIANAVSKVDNVWTTLYWTIAFLGLAFVGLGIIGATYKRR